MISNGLPLKLVGWSLFLIAFLASVFILWVATYYAFYHTTQFSMSSDGKLTPIDQGVGVIAYLWASILLIVSWAVFCLPGYLCLKKGISIDENALQDRQ